MNIFFIFLIFILSTSNICPIPNSLEEEIFTSEELLLNANNLCISNRTHNITVHAYFTPWNKLGKNFSVEYSNKFDIISPVWYTAEYKDDSVFITGSEFYDYKYLDHIHQKNIKIMPRLNFHDNFPSWIKKLNEERFSNKMIQRIVNYFSDNNFDGITLDIGRYLGQKEYPIILWNLCKNLKYALTKKNMSLIISFPIVNSEESNLVLIKMMSQFLEVVDIIQVMSYDYTSGNFNSPYFWIQKFLKEAYLSSINMSKILIGIPLYGYIYQSGKSVEVVKGTDFLKILNNTKNVYDWNLEAKEGQWKILKKRTVDIDNQIMTYPTIKFVKERIALAKQFQCGISFWELGQSLRLILNEI